MASPQEVELLKLLLIGISVMLSLAFAIIAFVVFYQRRLYKQQLRVQAMEHEHRKELLRASIETQEKERLRIAHDLHDELGGILSTAKLYMSRLSIGQIEQYGAIATKTAGLLDSAIQNLGTISHNLIPPTIEQFGLKSALYALCERVNISGGLQAQVFYGISERMEKYDELNLYRIVQELLNNSLKHSGATYAHIRLTENEGAITLSYSENGKGYDLKQIKSSSGLGMKTVASRAYMLQGSLNVDTAIGKGLKVTIVFPRNNPHPDKPTKRETNGNSQ